MTQLISFGLAIGSIAAVIHFHFSVFNRQPSRRDSRTPLLLGGSRIPKVQHRSPDPSKS